MGKIIGVAVLCLWAGQAFAAQRIKVKNQIIEAQKIGYYPHSRQISDFVVTQPVWFSLPRGNRVEATDLVYIDRAQNLSLIASLTAQTLNWRAPDGQTVNLDCGVHPPGRDVPVPSGRMITFYPSGEYKSGCDVVGGAEFQTTHARLNVEGEIDVTPAFQLKFAARVVTGTVQVAGQDAAVVPGTGIALYDSGHVQFFTPPAGTTINTVHPLYGALSFREPTNAPVAFSFMENEQVEQGVTAQDFVAKEFGFTVPAGSGVIFTSQNTLHLIAALFAAPVTVKTSSQSFSATKFSWNDDDRSVIFVVAKAFLFKSPNSDQVVQVPPGSQIQVSEHQDILAIATPKEAAGSIGI